MELVSLSCNNCGAPLEAPKTANYLTCAHCGSRLAIQRTSTAYFTEVMGQVAENTAQIAQGVQALDIDKWETCNIVCERAPFKWNKAGNVFIGRAVGVSGAFEAGRSEVFPESANMTRGSLIPNQESTAMTAFTNLMQRLAQEGWEPIVQNGQYWFSRQFRRRVR